MIFHGIFIPPFRGVWWLSAWEVEIARLQLTSTRTILGALWTLTLIFSKFPGREGEAVFLRPRKTTSSQSRSQSARRWVVEPLPMSWFNWNGAKISTQLKGVCGFSSGEGKAGSTAVLGGCLALLAALILPVAGNIFRKSASVRTSAVALPSLRNCKNLWYFADSSAGLPSGIFPPSTRYEVRWPTDGPIFPPAASTLRSASAWSTECKSVAKQINFPVKTPGTPACGSDIGAAARLRRGVTTGSGAPSGAELGLVLGVAGGLVAQMGLLRFSCGFVTSFFWLSGSLNLARLTRCGGSASTMNNKLQWFLKNQKLQTAQLSEWKLGVQHRFSLLE